MRHRINVVGAGLSGLTCALSLHRAGMDVRLFDQANEVGGRVTSRACEGFHIDQGFQVYLDAYPEAGSILDLRALDLHPFQTGALIRTNGRFVRLSDPFRNPLNTLRTLKAPIGTLRDKALVGLLRTRASLSSLQSLQDAEDSDIESFLHRFGFSAPFIDAFFRSFYGGILLETELRSSRRFFDFTFKMFTQGHATLPRGGMGRIPEQLAASLPDDRIHLGTKVAKIRNRELTLSNGTKHASDLTVVATDGETARRWLPSLPETSQEWKSVNHLAFAAPRSPLAEPVIVLNGEGRGLVHNFCVPSDVAPGYAPEGQALISVTVLGEALEAGQVCQVRDELDLWFGPETREWTLLEHIHIRKALNEQAPKPDNTSTTGYRELDGIFVCGDHLTSSSIEGAISSGLATSRAILNRITSGQP